MNTLTKKAYYTVIIFLAGTLLCFVVVGCSTLTRPPEVYQVEMHRSQVQTLRIANTHGVRVVVASSDDTHHQALEPNQTLDIAFVVISLSDVHLSETNPWYVIQNTVIHYIHEPDTPSFLKTSGTDVVLHLTPADSPPAPLRLSLQRCTAGAWEDAPAPSALHTVGTQSLAGIPARLCPQ